jgi:hypothetical protein
LDLPALRRRGFQPLPQPAERRAAGEYSRDDGGTDSSGPIRIFVQATASVRAGGTGGAMKGDWVEIVVDAGGESRTYEVSATRAGRRVEVSIVRNVVTVSEVTRGGSVVRTARFMANRVLALVEHPASRAPLPDDVPPDSQP